MRVKMRKTWLLAAALAMPAWAWAEESRPADLLFKASFDRLTAFADYAKGDPRCTLETSLELRAKPGIRKHGLLLEDGEKCVYKAPGNFHLPAGTISLWVKPANWTGADKRYVHFFRFYGRYSDNRKKGFGFVIDKSESPDVARAVMSFGARRDPDYRLYMTQGKATWKPGVWNKLDVTWDANHLAIYVNGKLGNRQRLPNVTFPELARTAFDLVRIWDGREFHLRSAKDRTFIDEVEIYKGAQSPDRILRRYLADRPAPLGELTVPVVSVPRIDGVTVDGKLDEDAWRRASRVPILVDIRSGFPCRRRAYASIGYDGQRIYLGLWSAKDGREPVAVAGRDGPVWNDDAFEVFLLPGEKPSPHWFQFIVNAKGQVFDTHGRTKSWNAEGLVVRAHVDADQWTAEMALPFSALGAGTPKPGDVWRGNFCRDWHRPKPASPEYVTWAYGGPSYLARPERIGRLRFGGAMDGVQVDLANGLAVGRLEASVGAAGKSKLDVSVTSNGRDVFKESRVLPPAATIKTHLRDVKLCVLGMRVVDPSTGGARLDYATRILVQQPIAATYVPDVPGRRLGVELDISSLDAEWRAAVQAGQASLDVSAALHGKAAGQATARPMGSKAVVWLPFQFAPGDYTVTYTLRAPTQPAPFVVEETLHVPDVSWVGAKVGVSDQVLEPWTPLAVKGDRAVSCWGREYEFDGPYPSRAVSQGDSLLRGPVRIVLTTEKDEAALTETARRVVKSEAHRVEFAGQGQFKSLGVEAEWSCWMEFDGLTVGTVTIRPPADGLAIRSLTMHIPLRPGLRHIRGERRRPNRTEWDGKRWQSAFEPFIWVHDEDVGFLYFCETEANWVYDRGQPVTIVRGGADAGIELRLISRPVRADRPLRYQFGFEATPVKALPKGWREHNYGPGRPIEHQTHQPWMNGYTVYDGLWHVSRPEALRQFDQERVNKGVLTFYYATTSCAPSNSPVYKLFQPLWNDPYPAQFGPYENKETRFRPASTTHHLMPVCPGAPTFVDHQLWLARELARQVGVRGFYTDTDGIWPCENRRHGCGFTDVFGKKGVRWTILNKRQFAKRMATFVRSLGVPRGRGYWMTHCHSKLVPPVHGFADAFWPGEEYTHRLYGDKWFYMDTMDEVDYRAQLNCRVAGVPYAFLPEFKRGTKDPNDVKQPQPSESLLAMAAVNDLNVSASYMHLPTMVQWWGIREKLGLKDVDRFIAYWRPNCPATTSTPEARVSVYTWPGRAALAVANRRASDAVVPVTVDLETLGLAGRPVQAIDMRRGEVLQMADGRLRVPVAGRSYTYVALTPKR